VTAEGNKENLENRELTWRHDWAWFVAYAVVMIGFMAGSIFWQHKLVLEEVGFVTLGVVALNIIRGIYIARTICGAKME
jgi:hypothetical protein